MLLTALEMVGGLLFRFRRRVVRVFGQYNRTNAAWNEPEHVSRIMRVYYCYYYYFIGLR